MSRCAWRIWSKNGPQIVTKQYIWSRGRWAGGTGSVAYGVPLGDTNGRRGGTNIVTADGGVEERIEALGWNIARLNCVHQRPEVIQ